MLFDVLPDIGYVFKKCFEEPLGDEMHAGYKNRVGGVLY